MTIYKDTTFESGVCLLKFFAQIFHGLGDPGVP